MTPEEILLLQRMADKLGFSEFREICKSQEQAYDMRNAFYKLIEKLDDNEIVKALNMGHKR